MASNNRIDERIEFIVEQQAQFAVNIQQLQEAQVNADKRMTRLENVMVRFYEDTSTRINALIDAQMRTDQKIGETDDRLNVFINVVERFITNGSKSASKKAVKKSRSRSSKKR